jgi:hypothetical protein
VERLRWAERHMETVVIIEFPLMRAEVEHAVGCLADVEYQQRVWIRREMPSPTYYDDLDTNIHVLFDDCKVLPDPTGMIGSVLRRGEEIERLAELGNTLDAMIRDLRNAPDAAYLADVRWPTVVAQAAAEQAVVAQAAAALAAMVHADSLA